MTKQTKLVIITTLIKVLVILSAGFFYLKPEVFNYIPAGEFCDFGYHVFPRMIDAGERIYAVSMDAPLIGIDMAGSYKKADEWASKLIRQD